MAEEVYFAQYFFGTRFNTFPACHTILSVDADVFRPPQAAFGTTCRIHRFIPPYICLLFPHVFYAVNLIVFCK